MDVFIILLRAVNVGGTGKLAMAEFRRACEMAGCTEVRTHLASGNAVVRYPGDAAGLASGVQRALASLTRARIGVIVRTGVDMAAIRDASPFTGCPGDRVAVFFLDGPVPADAEAAAKGRTNEVIHPTNREIHVHFPDGQGRSKLRLAAAASGTARNMNTVAALARLAEALAQETREDG